MKLGEVYRRGKEILDEADTENSAFDSSCLFRKAFGLDRQQRILHSEEPADAEKAERYLQTARERAAGRPLQYILGEWPFLDLLLDVGEGVLVPREETELLVRIAADRLRNIHSPIILDLCSGSGAVALGLASLLPDAEIYAAEKYDGAFSYLRRNIAKTGFDRVSAVKIDVLDPASAEKLPQPDCVVSNPPYVCAEEIPVLQAEVRREPREALDGGDDGLLFYRAIASIWLPKLKRGGFAAVEIGEGQAPAVQGLFSATLEEIRTYPDFNGIVRVTAGKRK